ncbi:hypothetical protein P148_SR1C00001G0569 [candidate division SR1 bacterium RAAC1_SR1_1]|nr:hypothetical protein P148_SR1C00001G0569 [candidate division SR1 bacterium RAAC1_SR1_1]
MTKEAEEVGEKEQDDDELENKEEPEVDDELLQLKKDFAKEYFTKLQQESGSLPGLILSETGTVEDYLTHEGVLDGIKDKVLLGMILKRVLEKETMDKLDAVKDKIAKIDAEDAKSLSDKLSDLRKEVGLSANDTPIDNSKIVAEQKQVDQDIQETIEAEKGSKQEKLLAMLDKILKYDQTNNVKYQRGGRESLKKGLDCSGLVVYALRQIGLKEMGAEGRAMFNNLKTEKLVKEEGNALTGAVEVKPGDLIFWDSKNPKYNFSVGPIPKIKKDGDTYRIHHVAFVKEVDYASGKITIIESNGVSGVTERKVSLEEEKKKKHKSDLYVGHVDYDQLMAYNGPKENILDQAA